MTINQMHQKLADGEPLILHFGIRKQTFYIGSEIITEKQFDRMRAFYGDNLKFSSTHAGLTKHYYHLELEQQSK